MAEGGGVPVIRSDMWKHGYISQVINNGQFVSPDLAGLGDGFFASSGALASWSVYLLRDVRSTATLIAAPQGEQQAVIRSNNSGVILHSPFTVAPVVGDEVLMLHPNLSTNLIAAIATVLTSISNLNTRINSTLFQMDFWSVYLDQIQLTAGAVDTALPNVIVAGLPAGATIVRATAFFKCRIIENTNGSNNSISGAQNIQVQKGGAGGYVIGIALVDGAMAVNASSREPGDVMMGNTDLSAKVTGNDTYNFQWTAAVAALANLNFDDIQVGLRVWYSV